jgi:hypothetical protein
LFRHQVGESLIAMGQQLSAKVPAQTQAPGSNAPAVISSTQTTSQSASIVPSSTVAKTKPVLEAQATPHGARPEKTDAESPANSIKVARGQRSTSAKVAAPSLNPPPIALSNPLDAPIATLFANKRSVLPQFAPANDANLHMEDAGAAAPAPPPKMYFEVGKFKQESWARKATDELAHLGFPTSVTQKGRIWGNAYYVLVGPYSDRDTAEVAHKNLASSGFKPRPFERGSRSFTLSSGVMLNQTRMAGDFMIRWESYVPEGQVPAR